MQSDRIGSGMRILLVVMTAFLALYLPAKYVLAWGAPELAAALGIPYLHDLPVATVVVVNVTVIIHSLLMIVVVRQVWQLAKVFRTGIFFSQENVIRIRRIGRYLILISALGVLAPLSAILSVLLSGRPVQFDTAVAQILFNFPAGTLVCGLLALIIARAFDRGAKMATEAEFTV